MEEKIVNIINEMSEYLDVMQLKKLQQTLIKHLSNRPSSETVDNNSYLRLFLNAKRIEGCTERTIEYYKSTIEKMLHLLDIPVRRMNTEDIRNYLVEYQRQNGCSKTTVDSQGHLYRYTILQHSKID